MDIYKLTLKSPKNLIIGEAEFTAASSNKALVNAGAILSSEEMFPFIPHGCMAEISDSAGEIFAKAVIIIEG